MSAQTLINALQALYHGEPSIKEQADKWLEQFQQSTDAWQVCNDVLHNREVGLEAHYFCAQTLRTKVGGQLGRNASMQPGREQSASEICVKSHIFSSCCYLWSAGGHVTCAA